MPVCPGQSDLNILSLYNDRQDTLKSFNIFLVLDNSHPKKNDYVKIMEGKTWLMREGQKKIRVTMLELTGLEERGQILRFHAQQTSGPTSFHWHFCLSTVAVPGSRNISVSQKLC